MRFPSRPTRIAALLLPVLVASSACDLAMAEFREKQTAEWRKTYEVQPGGRIEIVNVNGKIEVEPSAGSTVDVVATKTAKGASVDAARQALQRIDIQETASPSSVRVETKLQRGDSGFFSGASLEVHYAVRVPESVEVKVTTVNGGIELRGLKGRVDAETTNGGVKAREVSGAIDASTTNGGV